LQTHSYHRRRFGFTLAELLIALSILGVIATLTIPKVLTQSDSQKKAAAAKEVASMIAQAFRQYQQNSPINVNTKPSDLKAYMHYVADDTTTVIDNVVGAASDTCANATPCIKLHSGGIVLFRDDGTMTGLSDLDSIRFVFDPDGVQLGDMGDGPSKSLVFILYANGKLTTLGNMTAGTRWKGSVITSVPDTSWFNWN
jgi:prepilin-type N-terminal cleavage/methylation domain-containing protein